MCLTRSVFVETGEVDNTARRPVCFRGYHHPGAPGDWVIDWDFLYDSEADVSVQTRLDCLLPVEGNLTRRVNGNRDCLLVNKDAERRGAVHQTERLVFTAVEGAGLESVQDILPELRNVLWCGGTGQDGWRLRGHFSPWTGAGRLRGRGRDSRVVALSRTGGREGLNTGGDLRITRRHRWKVVWDEAQVPAARQGEEGGGNMS